MEFLKTPPKPSSICATFVRKFVSRIFQKSPNLVTLFPIFLAIFGKILSALQTTSKFYFFVNSPLGIKRLRPDWNVTFFIEKVSSERTSESATERQNIYGSISIRLMDLEAKNEPIMDTFSVTVSTYQPTNQCRYDEIITVHFSEIAPPICR